MLRTSSDQFSAGIGQLRNVSLDNSDVVSNYSIWQLCVPTDPLFACHVREMLYLVQNRGGHFKYLNT